MKLEVGKYYKDANGNKRMVITSCGYDWCSVEGAKQCHYWNGKSVHGVDPDLIAEWTDTPELQLQEGKFYRTRDGRKVGPLTAAADGDKEYPWWINEGEFIFDEIGCGFVSRDMDLISERQDEEQKSYMYHNPDDNPSIPEFAQLASEHAIKITVTIGEIVIEYDGRV